ncbi:hypothetical protein [Mycobacterium marinum]|uniref:hypothetical protein n=1 Tax=Mycobacterium marinum TaxID=1781 RepID=UPI0035675351
MAAMSNWYHVVCFHKGKQSQSQPVYVCDIEDDGGGQAHGYDRLTELRNRTGISQPDRDIGRQLRAYNATSSAHWLRAPGVDPEHDDVKTAMHKAFQQGSAKLHQCARVDIAQARNRPGHEWTLGCGVCSETVAISDARLLAALNRIRSKPGRVIRELTVNEQQTTETSAGWTPLRVAAVVVRLGELQPPGKQTGVS